MTRWVFCFVALDARLLLFPLDFADDDFRDLLDFFELELFFFEPESLAALLFELLEEELFEPAASAEIPSAPKPIIAASGRANLIILTTK